MIKAYLGDITHANTDVIVNAANPGLLGGGGVDGAIHRAAGPALLEACKQLKVIDGERCPFGEARLTLAGNLNCKYVVHAVGPIYHQAVNPDQVLVSAYRNALDLVKQHHCQSVTFPAISCGVYGFPHEAAARIAVSTCALPEYAHLQIEFALFSQDLLQLWLDEINLVQ